MGTFKTIGGSEVGEITRQFARRCFNDAAFIEVRAITFRPRVGGQALRVSKEDPGAIGTGDLEDAAAAFASAAALAFVKLDGAGPAGFVTGAGIALERGGVKAHVEIGFNTEDDARAIGGDRLS